jgi:Ni2+-binding GTPase involved in maturation of urease and hydrogenase
VKVIIISGSMGAGKTAVMGEASDVLLSRSINHASIDLDIVATARLRTREPGMRQDEFVERSRTLEAIVAAAGVEDFSIADNARDITAVATELLQRAGWI